MSGAEAAARLIDAHTGESLSAGAVEHEVGFLAARLAGPPSLAVVMPDNDLGGALAVLAAMAAGHAVYVANPQASAAARAALLDAYRPAWVLAPEHAEAGLAPRGAHLETARGYGVWSTGWTTPVHPRLQLLLSTSGSTGAPKSVKLSREALDASLDQIRRTLSPGPDERMLLSLPIHHVYGLTMLLSHLVGGASVVVGRKSVLDPAFGALCRRWGVTCLPSVSFSFDAMRRIGWERLAAPSLRRLLHSGDRLNEATLAWAVETSGRHGVEFVRMYGLTEACGRVCVLPPAAFVARPGAVGKVVPGGAIEITDDGEVVYRGPNLMAGYAVGAADLAELAHMDGLHTGDEGRVDDQGYLTLTGRRSRLAKVFGVRINLDDLESALGELAPFAVELRGDEPLIYTEAPYSDPFAARIASVLRAFELPPAVGRIAFDTPLPRSQTGKILRGAHAAEGSLPAAAVMRRSP
ncbi:AMP-binding protein [Caulobacter endophyticus]|uniref:AMP-binding protein n=1 Tax=Caulobacter endophyticus TaxID=2172652 RepID=UPI00240F2674|nr:AMP-binding protein [Caulobacter endophyticus]MDG2531335.1 AMP-binding protein [Caulobacter endophyticus]